MIRMTLIGTVTKGSVFEVVSRVVLFFRDIFFMTMNNIVL